MTDSIKLPVEIEYNFRWENPCFKRKIEVFACSEHVATVDEIGTLHLNSDVPCRIEVTRAARIWAGWEKATPDSRPPTTDSRPPTTDSSLIANLPLNPANTPITREQASAIRQLIRASYFNVPGLHSHVLLEVFDRLILEGNCIFDDGKVKKDDLECYTRACNSICSAEVSANRVSLAKGWTISPGEVCSYVMRAVCPLCSHKADNEDSSSRNPKPEAPLDDRCTNCKEFDLNGCPSCGPVTHAKVYGVDDSEVSRQASAIGQSSCRLCSADPKPNGFASPRHCAFRSGTFHRDNWSCGTLDKIREAIFNGTNQAWHITMFNESCAVLPIPNECKTCHGFLILAYYKNLRVVGKAIVLCEDLGPSVLNLTQAEDILNHLPSAADSRPPTADSQKR